MPQTPSDLTREELEKLVIEHALQPALRSQNPYIGNGPEHEILASLQPNGLYHVQLLDKRQVQESVEKTIRVYREYALNAERNQSE